MTFKISLKIILALIVAILIFHVCIIFKIIPYDITWGGRLKNDSEMYVFESISILLNLILGWMLLMKGGLAKRILPKKIVNVVLWIFLVLFVFNTIGNLFAETNFEKWFSLLTLALFVLIGIVLLKKKPSSAY